VAPVPELIRIVSDSGGALRVGTGLPGRGAWLCRATPGCFELAVKRHAFSRALRHEVTPEAIEKLRARLAPGP
jgi:predicted RNA-binding protein YlxR (DUF448 family)